MPDKCLICGNEIIKDEPCENCLEAIEEDLEIEFNNDDFSAEDYGDIDEDGYEYDH